ncbi:MAG: nitrile hydratase subunit beta [Actinomycetota bacterium]|nr:nitrile hydratase subunit beta [Actinomycetota bacterium]
MDGIHDMGGMQGFGGLHIEPDEPVFHEEWHRRVFGMGALAARLSGTNQPAFRHAIERVHPVQYLVDGYYGRWLDGTLNLLIDSGVIARGAVEARVRNRAGEDVEEPPEPTLSKPDYEATGPGSLREVDTPPRFNPGDRVRVKEMHPVGHTRLPHYVRSRTGTVERTRPAQLFPDTHAHFQGENPQHVYAVAFDSRDVWGDDGEPCTIYVDLYEGYLEAGS